MSNEDRRLKRAQRLLGPTPGKPQVDTEMREKTITGSDEVNGRLRAIGDRLSPEGFEYIGSIATHIYKERIGLGRTFISQNCVGDATPTEANLALYKASVDVARAFGWKPSHRQQKFIKQDS